MTREDVIRQIVARESRQERLDEPALCFEEPELHSAALEHFGTWDTALRYAGVRRPQRRKTMEYSAEVVIRRIRKLCSDGYDLSGKRNRIRDPQLYAAAYRHFGRWRGALQAAGINLQHLSGFSRSMKNRKRRILRAIQSRREQGQSLEWSRVCLENRALATAARTVFGTWKHALAASIAATADQRSSSPQRWTKDRVIERIRLRNAHVGSLKYRVASAEDAALVSAARRYFGSWKNALAEAGVDRR